MVRTYERRGNHRFVGYCCKTYKTQGKKVCTNHAIQYEQLKTAVLESVQKEARNILTPDDIHYLNQIEYVSSLVQDYHSQIQYLEKEMERKENYKKKSNILIQFMIF